MRCRGTAGPSKEMYGCGPRPGLLFQKFGKRAVRRVYLEIGGEFVVSSKLVVFFLEIDGFSRKTSTIPVVAFSEKNGRNWRCFSINWLCFPGNWLCFPGNW